MRHRSLVRTLASAVTAGVLVSSCVAPSEEVVLAMRYQVWVCPSILEAEHGGGKWIEEFWLPNAGVSFNAVQGLGDDAPVGHAFFATMSERTEPKYLTPTSDAKPTQMFVPRQVAEEAVAMARAQRELDAQQRSRGPEWANKLRIRQSSEFESTHDE